MVFADTSARWDGALRAPHTVAVRLDVTWPDGSTTADVPIVDGEVRVDGTAAIRRQCTVQVLDGDLWESVQLGGATLRPYRGVVYGDGTSELVPLGVFEVRGTSVDLERLTPGKLTAPDRWRRIQRTRFYWPEASRTGATIPVEWARIVTAALPYTVGVTDQSGSTQVLAPTVWDRDRDKAATDLATSIGCEGFFDVLGNLLLRRVTSPTDPSVWRVNAGEQAVLLGGTRERTDERTYSAVVVTPSRTDGTAPFGVQVVEDTDPASQTYTRGPFGQVARFYSSPAITTAIQAKDAARKLLEQVRGVATSLTLSSLPNPALDAGDPITVVLPDGTSQVHIIDSLTVPLGVAAMPIQTRLQLTALPDEAA